MLTIKRLSLDDARKLIHGAAAKAKKIGVPMCIAITDEAGNLIAFERMNGAKILSVDLSADKAFTAAVSKRPTHEYKNCASPAAWYSAFTHRRADGFHRRWRLSRDSARLRRRRCRPVRRRRRTGHGMR